MTNEEAPLLGNNHNLVYEIFSPRQKRWVLAIVCWSGLVPFLASGTFTPSIPQVASDLDSTGEVISYAISIHILGGSIGGLIGATYAKFYGRRPAYLYCLPVMFIGSLGVAMSQSVPQLLAWRCIQAMGSSPGVSVGAGVIADIYKLEERGTALGNYFGTGLLGLALAPTLGGFIAHYWSWRGIHYMLAILTLGVFLCIILYFPETSHPGTRGIDKLKRLGRTHPKWRPFFLNPITQLGLLRGPTILSVAVLGFIVIMADFTLLVPLAYTMGKKYGIENEALIGACFLPLGIGNAIGAPLSGWISDKTIIRWRKKRGFWYPEDRLRASFFGLFLPFTVLLQAVLTTYMPTRLGLILNLIIMFFNGIGTDVALTPLGAYVVDVMHSNSTEVTAAVNAFRSYLLAASTAMLLPMINTHGHIFTNSVVSLLCIIGFGLLWMVIKYGDSMRKWVDIGYSTADTN